MTQQEADLVVQHAPPDVRLEWVRHFDPRYVGLLGSPACPLLGKDDLCRIYEHRPLNCRRFMCLRDAGEVLEPGGPWGCRNTARRVESDRATRRFMVWHTKRQLGRWGYKHGWTDDDVKRA